MAYALCKELGLPESQSLLHQGCAVTRFSDAPATLTMRAGLNPFFIRDALSPLRDHVHGGEQGQAGSQSLLHQGCAVTPAAPPASPFRPRLNPFFIRDALSRSRISKLRDPYLAMESQSLLHQGCAVTGDILAKLCEELNSLNPFFIRDALSLHLDPVEGGLRRRPVSIPSSSGMRCHDDELCTLWASGQDGLNPFFIRDALSPP